jgi:nucleotide-binding universal stress UspA family protein
MRVFWLLAFRPSFIQPDVLLLRKGPGVHPQFHRNPERTIMFTNILIATDGSELASRAVQEGLMLAKQTGAKVTAVTVTSPFHAFTMDPMVVENTPEQYKKNVAQQTTKTLSAVAELATAAGVQCDTVAAENDHPYQAIIDTARSKGCDLVVMASHRRHGLDGLFHGSETLKVLSHSEIPVLVG